MENSLKSKTIDFWPTNRPSVKREISPIQPSTLVTFYRDIIVCDCYYLFRV